MKADGREVSIFILMMCTTRDRSPVLHQLAPSSEQSPSPRLRGWGYLIQTKGKTLTVLDVYYNPSTQHPVFPVLKYYRPPLSPFLSFSVVITGDVSVSRLVLALSTMHQQETISVFSQIFLVLIFLSMVIFVYTVSINHTIQLHWKQYINCTCTETERAYGSIVIPIQGAPLIFVFVRNEQM